MSSTLELLDALHPLRRRVALVLLPLGVFLALVAFWVSSGQGILDPVDRFLLPFLAFGFSGLALALFFRPKSAAWVLPVAHTLVALYLLATLGYQLLLVPNPQGLSPASFWFPFVYFSSFLFFPSFRAVRLGAVYLLTVFFLALLGGARGHLEGVHLNALAQFFGSNLAYVLLLYMLVRIKEGYLEAQMDAYTDFLTGLRNRRYGELILERELARLQRYGRPLVLLLLDLDDFKKVNDIYGHDMGDLVLRTLAQALEGEIRVSDRAVRLGGEEFMVILPETGLAQALPLAERLRQRVRTLKVPPVPGLSVSIGLAQAAPTDSPLSLLKRADEALYRAKRKGKDRVEVA